MMTALTPILQAEKICFSYNEEGPILKDISFSLFKGDSLGVLGPNGGGKSTLMKIIVGLLKANSGNLFFEDKLSTDYSKYPYDLISYVPQNSELNTILPVKVSEYLGYTESLYKKHNKLHNEYFDINELLKLVGIFHKKDSLISKMSGGEKQRVLLARALINRPKLLVLDEPTKGLDSNGQDQLLAIIEKIKTTDQTAVIIVDHNINQIVRNCHKILCLNRNFHWHNHSDLLTKNILEDVYYCEFEHLLIHENDLKNSGKEHTDGEHHHFCDHDHSDDKSPHSMLRRKK